jgi:hypothetical protein
MWELLKESVYRVHAEDVLPADKHITYDEFHVFNKTLQWLKNQMQKLEEEK